MSVVSFASERDEPNGIELNECSMMKTVLFISGLVYLLNVQNEKCGPEKGNKLVKVERERERERELDWVYQSVCEKQEVFM